MHLISARDDFWSNTKLAVSDAIRDVDLVGDAPSTIISEAAFLNGLQGKRILMLMHGYNNEPEDVHSAYAMIESKVDGLVTGAHDYDQVIGYIWPGGDDALDYFRAKKRANALGRRVGIWLDKISRKASDLDVMSHSMGVRVVLRALKSRPTLVARNVFTLAGAVDNESIEINEEFHASTKRCENTFVFHSKHDGVLKVSYRLADRDSALGLHGPEDPHDIITHSSPATPGGPNVYVVNCKDVIKRHGAYKESDAVYSYINNFLGGGQTNQFSRI